MQSFSIYHLVFLFIIPFNIFCQNKITLKNIDKVSLKVNFYYLNGDPADYKLLHINETGIQSEVALSLRLAGIQVVESDNIPQLTIDIRVDNNHLNYPSGKDGWFTIDAEIYLTDKVRLKRNSKIEFLTRIWEGNFAKSRFKVENSMSFQNSHIADLSESFISEYLEVNPK